MDDAIILPQISKYTMTGLKQVLKKANDNGIKVNLSKCDFGVSKIKFLGHELSKNSVSPDCTKIYLRQVNTFKTWSSRLFFKQL